MDKELIVTDLNCTRFYWTVDEAISLIFDCLKLASSPKPYVPEMKSIILKDLLKAMSKKYLKKGGTLKIKEIGLRQGENLHESLDKYHKNSFESEKYTIQKEKESLKTDIPIAVKISPDIENNKVDTVAEILIKSGYEVQGSDVSSSKIIDRLISLGVKIFIGHDKNNIKNASIVVYSSAIKQNNPEIVEIHHLSLIHI